MNNSPLFSKTFKCLISVTAAIRENYLLIMVLACATYLGMQRHGGFIIYLVFPPIVLYQFVQLFRHRKSIPLVVAHLIAVAMVILASLIIFGVHEHLHDASRAQADQVVHRIDQFWAARGHYPGSLTDIGVDEALRRDLGLTYLSSGEDVMLIYAATYVSGDKWLYSFSSHEWSYVTD